MADSLPSNLLLCYETAVADMHRLVNDYWGFSTEELGGKWIFTVREIAHRHNISYGQLPQFVRRSATAFDLDTRCVECNEPREIGSRTDYTHTSQGPFECPKCQAKTYAAIQRERRIIEEAVRAKKLQALEDLTSRVSKVDYSCLSASDMVSVFAMMLASDRTCGDGTLDYAIVSLFPSSRMRREFLKHLYASGILTISIETPLSAIHIDRTGMLSFDELDVMWCLSPDTFGRSFPEVFALMGQAIDTRENHLRWQESLSELWWKIGLEDAEQFLQREIQNYRFSEYRVGEKTELALKYSLQAFSIPQVRRLLKRVIEKAAALSRNRSYSSPHALNTIPGNLINAVDRAISDGWTIYPLFSDWDQEPLLLRILFNRILRTGLQGFRTTNGLSIMNTQLDEI